MLADLMVEILCPHCDEEIGLDDDAVGEFSCPLCDGEFTWGALFDEEDDDSAKWFAWKSFWIGLGIPNFLLFIAPLWADPSYYSITFSTFGEMLLKLSVFSFIALFIYGIYVKNKAMWLGTLAGVLIAPIVYFASCAVGLPYVFDSR